MKFFIDSLNSTHICLCWRYILNETNKHVMKSMFHSNTCALLTYSDISLFKKMNEISKKYSKYNNSIFFYTNKKRNKRELLLQILCRQKSVKCQRQVDHCYLSVSLVVYCIILFFWYCLFTCRTIFYLLL